ncbi:MAG: hypothetical protein J5I67_01165 [Ignavibacterium album]|nr:hypothetical protein [Ignavibacterium album]
MKILLIEDTDHKRDLIVSFIEEEFSNVKLVLRRSYNSGLREIIKNQDYALILLDMSLPNYDIEPGESGGDFESMAGKFLLQEMYRRDIGINVAIITMYKNYTDDGFNADLRGTFENYLGVVFFNFNDHDSWRSELKAIIKSI